MAKAYIGADNVSKLVKKMYIGVDGMARKVTKAYRGVDGVAKLVYSGEIPKKEYLYGGTSTFVHTAHSRFNISPGTDYSMTEDKFVLQVEKYDTTPLYVYFDDELITTVTTEGEQTITIDGGASILDSKETITVKIVSEGTYGLGEQDFYQFWDYTGTDSKNNSDKTYSGGYESATLSDNVIKVYNYAVNANNRSIPSRGLVTIGDYGFGGVSWTSFEIPDTVTSIGKYAFYLDLYLTSVVIPSSVTSIGQCAFMGTALTDITFKHGVSDPLSIHVDTSTPTYCAFYTGSEGSEPKATNVYHNGNESVLNYDWALCNRTVTFIQGA